MAKVKKSITRLLAERKALADRINIASGQSLIGIQKGNRNPTVLGASDLSVAAAEALYRGNLDKVIGLISYHRRITAALIASNASTRVTIGAETMTVAEAIERKTSVKQERTLLNYVMASSQTTQTKIDLGNKAVEETIERQLIQIYGGEKAKITVDARKETADSINAASLLSVIDPNKLREFATKELERISQFETEVDFVLSESNAKTEIELEDETFVAPIVIQTIVENIEARKLDPNDPQAAAASGM
jgi:hypothetical protein